MESTKARAIQMAGLIATVARWMARTAGLLMVLGAFGICVDIFCRAVLGSSIKGMPELNGYALAIGSAWSFGHTLVQRGHVRVDVIHNLLGPTTKAVLDVLALAIMALIAGMLCHYAFGVLMTSVRYNTVVAFSRSVHLWWFQAAWVIGLAAFAGVAITLLVRASLALARRDIRQVREIAGTIDTEDEVEAEIAATDRRLGRTASDET